MYDFRVAPLTYDFVTAVALSYCFFSKLLGNKGEPRINLILVIPNFRNVTNYEQEVAKRGLNEQRFQNIILGTCAFMDNVSDIRICKDLLDFPEFSNGDLVFPPHFDVARIDYSKGMTQIPCNFIFFEKFNGGRPVHLFKRKFFSENPPDINSVSLSLRNSFQKPEREVSLQDWFDLYKTLESKGKRVTVIPDHDDYFGEKKYSQFDWNVNGLASHSIRERLSLYSVCKHNIASPSGLNVLLMFSDNSFYIPGYLDSRFPTSNPSYMARKGPALNSQLFWCRKDQKIGWQEFSETRGLNLITACLDYVFN